MSKHERTSPRYEIKVPLQGIDKATALQWIRLHPAQWHESYPPRQVNNIYFDSLDLRALRANLNGLAEREKLRLRWYGPSISTVENARLELKRRQGSIGWKDIIHLDHGYRLDDSTMWHDFSRLLTTDLPPLAKSWILAHPQAVLVSHYQRLYYETYDGELRLTLDTDLRTYPQGSALCPNITRTVPVQPARVVVLELKGNPQSVERLSDSVAAFPIAPYRFSKYVQGLAAVWGLKSEVLT